MDGKTHVLGSLYDALDQDPLSVDVQERLIEVWKEIGDEIMASEIASALIQIDPNNKAARRQLQDRRESLPKVVSSARHPEPERMQEDFLSSEKSLEIDYTSLKVQAKLLREEVEAVRAYGKIPPEEDEEEVISNLQAISDGHISAAISITQVLSVREIARDIIATPGRCQELIVEDFETLVRWAACQNPPLGPDAVRERLVKRKTLLEAALPEPMQKFSAAALTHIEREHLQKKYVNSETMIGGDKIEDIPQQNFFVSEDNYAWDMDELAQAISANSGVMRNPLSRKMFSESDIRMILAHPLGQRLRLLQQAQSQLKQGVRPATIDLIEKLGCIMLAEEAVDAAPSREAMDEFLAFVATIPEAEQNTINSLKIPARDGFSGQPFDYTIGESVRDAKANTTCFHKVGDFLCQAAAYLWTPIVRNGEDAS